MEDINTTLNFFKWLEYRKLAEDLPQVQYLAVDKRWQYMVEFAGNCVYRRQSQLSSEATKFSTKGLWSEQSGDHVAIWVCSPEGDFFTNEHAIDEFHHSSFQSGGRVLAGGEWIVSAGKILIISNKTGHYASSPHNLFSAMQLLAKRADLSRTVVQLKDFATGGPGKFVWASDFLARAGDVGNKKGIVVFEKNPAPQPKPPKTMAKVAQDLCGQDRDFGLRSIMPGIPLSEDVYIEI
jgi:hypothetical protein